MRGAVEGIDRALEGRTEATEPDYLAARKLKRLIESFNVDGFVIPSDLVSADWHLDPETGFLTVTFMPKAAVQVVYKQ